jgi:hypothetical protein
LKKIFIILSLLVLYQQNIFSQFGEWQVVGEMPFPVKGCQAVAMDSLIYIIGGFSEEKQAGIDLVQAYNPYTNAWKNAGTIGTKRYGLIARRYGDSVLVFGGSSSSDSLQSFYMEFWNPNTYSNNTYTDNINFNRNFSTGEIYNDNLCLFGGYPSVNLTDTSHLPYIIEYNISQSKVTFSDTGLYRASNPILQMSVLVDDNIFIFGGIQYGIIKEVYKFNITSHLFERVSVDLNQARAGGAAVYDGRKDIYIIGGSNESSMSLSSMEVLSTSPDTTINISPSYLNYPRSEFAAVYFENSIYIFGGRNSFNQVVPEVEKFTPGNATAIVNKDMSTMKYGFKLNSNYPNPFNSSTVINYQLYENGYVILKVLDILGNEIKTLVSEEKPSGNYKEVFDASQLCSGFYIVSLTVNSNSSYNKILLIK